MSEKVRLLLQVLRVHFRCRMLGMKSGLLAHAIAHAGSRLVTDNI